MYVLIHRNNGMVVARPESENGFHYWTLLYNKDEAHVFKDKDTLLALLPIVAMHTETLESDLAVETVETFKCEYKDVGAWV